MIKITWDKTVCQDGWGENDRAAIIGLREEFDMNSRDRLFEREVDNPRKA
jgi:hypothetical protein